MNRRNLFKNLLLSGLTSLNRKISLAFVSIISLPENTYLYSVVLPSFGSPIEDPFWAYKQKDWNSKKNGMAQIYPPTMTFTIKNIK